MKTNLIIVLAIIAVLVVGAGVYAIILLSKPAVILPEGGNNVEISSFAFSPATLTIDAGETVTWVNKDIAPHSIVSDSGSELNSPTFGKEETYSHVFNTAGTFAYHCSVHPSMKGAIIVG